MEGAWEGRALVGEVTFDKLGRRITKSSEYIVDADGVHKVGMTEVVREPPQVLYFTKLHDWDEPGSTFQGRW